MARLVPTSGRHQCGRTKTKTLSPWNRFLSSPANRSLEKEAKRVIQQYRQGAYQQTGTRQQTSTAGGHDVPRLPQVWQQTVAALEGCTCWPYILGHNGLKRKSNKTWPEDGCGCGCVALTPFFPVCIKNVANQAWVGVCLSSSFYPAYFNLTNLISHSVYIHTPLPPQTHGKMGLFSLKKIYSQHHFEIWHKDLTGKRCMDLLIWQTILTAHA